MFLNPDAYYEGPAGCPMRQSSSYTLQATSDRVIACN